MQNKEHVLLNVVKKVITVLEVQEFCHLDVMLCSLADIIDISKQPTASIVYQMRGAAVSPETLIHIYQTSWHQCAQSNNLPSSPPWECEILQNRSV